MLALKRSGFTLLEILIVLVILAVLAGLAVPGYISSIEKQRKHEAIGTLGAIRSSQNRYWTARNTFTSTPADLDFNFNAAAAGSVPHYTYSLVSAAAATFVAEAQRNATDYAAQSTAPSNYTVRISETGAITSQY